MSKKIDIKRTLGKQSPPLSIEDVEEMTRLIHNKTTEPILVDTDETPKMNVVSAPDLSEVAEVVTAKYEKTTEKVVEKALEKIVELPPTSTKSGRKPKMLMETERLLRVSVDLPESLFIQLKIVVIQQQTDMKTYIRELVAKDLSA